MAYLAQVKETVEELPDSDGEEEEKHNWWKHGLIFGVLEDKGMGTMPLADKWTKTPQKARLQHQWSLHNLQQNRTPLSMRWRPT